MSNIASWIVIAGTIGSLIFFALILYMNRKSGRPGQTTGHNYDGIEEYDNPLPAWWFWGFMLSIIFAAIYLTYYPGLGNFSGLGKWTQINELEGDQVANDLKYGPLFAAYAEVPLEELSKDEAALKMGQRLFSNNCAMCHGSGATGGIGFPNLLDDEWMWGGSAEQIKASINNGRNGIMAPWGAVLKEEGVKNVTSYVLSLAGREVEKGSAAQGKTHFMTYCAVCHGPEGKGNSMFGAPDLTNEIWLHGNSRSRIEQVIAQGKSGVMPAFKNKLGKERVHILAAYVSSLSKTN